MPDGYLAVETGERGDLVSGTYGMNSVPTGRVVLVKDNPRMGWGLSYNG